MGTVPVMAEIRRMCMHPVTEAPTQLGGCLSRLARLRLWSGSQQMTLSNVSKLFQRPQQ